MSFISGVGGTSNPYLNVTLLDAPYDASSATAAATTGSTTFDPFGEDGPFANLNLSTSQQQQIQQILDSNASSSSSSGPPSPSQLYSLVESVLTPQQQQTMQNDLQTMSMHHHHHGSDDGSQQTRLLSQLDLTSDQQSQIASILSTAQSSGTSSADVLSQIDGILTPDQQEQLVALFSSSSTSSGSTTTPSYVVDTNA